MHLFTLVLVPSDTGDVVGEVARLLSPFGEKEGEVPCGCQTGKRPVPCSLCEGAGALIININFENTKWDWWMVGGRFDGRVRNEAPERMERDWALLGYAAKEPEELDDGRVKVEFRHGDEWEAAERRIHEEMVAANIVPVRELPPDLSCWALITREGEWHECGHAYADPTPAEQQEWDRERRALLTAQPIVWRWDATYTTALFL